MVNYCRSPKCLVGKTCIVTGANAGLGYETALEFAKRGGRVILGCRNEDKANDARDKIIEATNNQNVVVRLIDMENLESVRKFAENILRTEGRLDILVNNAGTAFLPEKLTQDGLQLTMQVNYFSAFLLTILLLDLLKKTAPSRIVNVSSAAAKYILGLDLEDMNGFPGKMRMYARTKLANIMFTQELARRLEGTGVTTYSLHPGGAYTQIHTTMPRLVEFMVSKFFLTAEQGAQTQIYLSLQDGIEEHSGQHFQDCQVVGPYWGARSPENAKKLWEISEKMVGLKQRDDNTKNNA